MNQTKKRSTLTWVIYAFAAVSLLLAAGIAVFAVQIIEDGPNQEGGLLGQPTVGGPFTLVNGGGQTMTEAAYAGKVMMVYFGYTYCPDICPTELALIADAMDLLDADDAADVAPIFITVDPERDTPSVMKDYVANFHDSMIGLTGSLEQVAAAAKAYRVYYAKREDTSEAGYTMDHTSYIYVMDRNGRYFRHFRMSTPPEEIASGLKDALR